MIPAAIQAPQAVAETINSFCPPGLSVAPVGTTIALYRGASKTPFASFAYTGPDSVLGIVVATWRIALADHGQPVTNITNVTTAPTEETKALVDALDILGWNRACEPTAWVRSYLNVEQIKLSEALQATAQTEKLSAEANDALARQRVRARVLLDALRKLGYHSDMNLDEWTEARVKQRDATESRVRVLESEATALRESEQRAVDASMNQRAEIEEAVGWCFANPGRGLAAELANDAAKALQEKLVASAPEAKTLRWAMAQAMHIGAETAIRWAENEDRRLRRAPGADEALTSETATAALRKEAIVVLGWDGMGDPKAWADEQVRNPGTRSGAPLLPALDRILTTAGIGRDRGDVIERVQALADQKEGARQEARVAVDQNVKLVKAMISTPIRRVTLPGGTQVRYLIHDGTDWVEAPARSEQPKTVQAPLFAADGDTRFKIADARWWKRGETTAQDRTGRVWISAISGSCAGMTGLPFKPGATVRFVDASDKLILAGKVVRYEAKNITGDRLEWEAEVLHEVDLPGQMRDMTSTTKAPPVTDEQRKTACFIVGDKVLAGPRWTGITWMSKKGRAKTCRIEGLQVHSRIDAVADAEGKCGPDHIVIKVPTSPWNLPAKLVRRIHAGKPLAVHVGPNAVFKGCVAKVDASAISSMLLYVAT